MGAKKKCFLLLTTIICFIFLVFILITVLTEYFSSQKNKNKNESDNVLLSIIFIIIIFIIWLYLLYKTFEKNIKIILISKNSIKGRNITNINNEINSFIKRATYKFKNTIIKRKNYCSDKKIKKKITCITILDNNKILLGFSEGTIILCHLEKNYKLNQIFSFNKFKEKKILNICQSIKYKDEFMISVKTYSKPVKLIKLNLDYKYSLIKVLARDKAYLIIDEFENKKWKNVFKIISYKNGQFLIADRKGIYLKEKRNTFDYDDTICDEYQITQEYVINIQTNEEIHDIIKTSEESFATLEKNNNISNLCFYKLNNLKKDGNYISNIITSNSLSNRLCSINKTLIAVLDSSNVYIINIFLRQKVNSIKLNDIQKSGIDLFYDGSIIFIDNPIINGYKIPHIIKINKNRRDNKYNSYNITNTTQEFKNIDEQREFIGSKIKLIKCFKHSEILIMTNSQGKLFIWEGINKNNENIKLNNF